MPPDDSSHASEGREAFEGPGIDPFSDLMFALTAGVIAVLAILWPLARPPAPPDRIEDAAIQVEGRVAAPLTAMAAGLSYRPAEGAEKRLVPLGEIGQDPGLRARLAAIREEDRPLVLLIEPDGLEAAFLLEPVLAAYGPTTIRQVRLAGCADPARAGSPAACGRGSASGPGR